MQVSIETSAGVKYGSGPLATARKMRLGNLLDRAGSLSFEVSQSDLQAAEIVPMRYVRCGYFDDTGVWVEELGLIENLEFKPDVSGYWKVVGHNLLAELAQPRIPYLAIENAGAAQAVDDALDAIMAYAPAGWTITHSPHSAETVYGVLRDETVLDALIYVAEQSGEHFYLSSSTGRNVTWLTSSADSGVRAIKAGPDTEASNPYTALVAELVETKDAYELVARVKPRGAGFGAQQVTLLDTTRVAGAGYTLSAANNYLKRDASETAYGLIEKALVWPQVERRLEAAPYLALASNALYDLSLRHLERFGTPHTCYQMATTKLETAIIPGNTVWLDYQTYLDGELYVDINDNDLYCLGVETSVSLGGALLHLLTLSETDGWPLTEAEMVARDLKALDYRIRHTATPVPATHVLLSAQHGDTTPAAAVRGDIITAQGASPLWTRLGVSAPAATHRNYVGTANGDTEPGYKALFDATVPVTIAEGASAAAGTAEVAARRDHTHGAPATWTATGHHLAHENGGGDEISVAGLSGELADAQPPKSHAHSTHSSIGANDHHNQAHAVDGADHTITGAALSVVGATSANTLGLITPSSAPGAASALLKTDSNGNILLPNLVVGPDLSAYPTGTGQAYSLAELALAKQLVTHQIIALVGSANILAFVTFDQKGASTTLTDRGLLGHNFTLSANGDTLSPGLGGLATYLTINGGAYFSLADDAHFSFVGVPFSFLCLVNPVAFVSPCLLAKYDATTGSTQMEWGMWGSSGKFYAMVWDDSAAARIGRYYNTSLSGDVGSWVTYGMCYTGGTTNAAVKIIRNGVQVDDSAYNTGTFVASEDKTAAIASYYKNAAGTKYNSTFRYALMLITSTDLSATSGLLVQLDALMRGWAGQWV
jgi:hypothetical protein